MADIAARTLRFAELHVTVAPKLQPLAGWLRNVIKAVNYLTIPSPR